MASFTLPPMDAERRRAAEREAERLDYLKLRARLASERPGARWTPAQTSTAAALPLLCVFLIFLFFFVFLREISAAVVAVIELLPIAANASGFNITLPNGTSR